MRRRKFVLIAGSSVAAVSGCLGSDGETPTDDGNETNTDDGNETNTDDGTEAEPDDETETAEDVVSAGERIVEDMDTGAFDQALARFTDQAQSQLSAGRLEEIWLGYTAVGGAFEEIDETEQTVQSGFDAADLTLAFEEGTHELRVLADDQAGYGIVGLFVNDEYERPAYVDPDTFDAEEISLETDDCLMDGEITVPADAEDVPGVVLVHGSDPTGAADMNLDGGGSRVFQDLAEGLSSRGVAVLRYDRRSHACPNSLSTEEWTLEAITVDDSVIAVNRLRDVPAVDPDRVVVAGHSLGGMAAPRIAARDGELGGIAMLAAPAREFYEIFVEQYEHLATLGEYEWEAMADLYERWQDRIDRIREGDYDDSDTVLGYPGALWTSADEYDPLQAAREIETPAFLLQGRRDYQVSAERDFQLWQSELSDRPETTFELYDGLNHLFQYGEGPSTQTEYALRNSVDQAVVADIASWVTEL